MLAETPETAESGGAGSGSSGYVADRRRDIQRQKGSSKRRKYGGGPALAFAFALVFVDRLASRESRDSCPHQGVYRTGDSVASILGGLVREGSKWINSESGRGSLVVTSVVIYDG